MSDPIKGSGLLETLDQLARRSASAVVARSRVSCAALNAAILRRLKMPMGSPDAMLADPVFEAARNWAPAVQNLGALEGTLLHPDLVRALHLAGEHAMPRERQPYAHQLEAWQLSLAEQKCVLISSGTGSGKTECFLIPILDDILRQRRPGGGVRAILLYPLNALIESQRERLAAWAEGLGGRVHFALFNGDTPESPRQVRRELSLAELGDRKSIRDHPPEILVTNVTMLEYLLLRAKDRAILEASAGALRWIVLDEAHSYVGAQAAEMALLLRRVRAAFGVAPEQVRLIATSATIGGEVDAAGKLRQFLAALAGRPEEEVRVIEGRTTEPSMPPSGPDAPIDVAELVGLGPEALWARLAPHPRIQELRLRMNDRAVGLGEMAQYLFHDPTRKSATQAVLDAAALAEQGGQRLLPWRAHLFHRAQGGVWACIDPGCPNQDPEVAASGAGWGYGAIYLAPRTSCRCGALVFELVACGECGTPHLLAGQQAGAEPRLEALVPGNVDEFAIDAEPGEDESEVSEAGRVWLAPATGASNEYWVDARTGRIFDNTPAEGCRLIRLRLISSPDGRNCCAGAPVAWLAPLRYGPAFFMGNGLPLLLEALAPPRPEPGLPMGGRRALSFSDSRQGVARLAAKLQQDAERTLTRAFLWHAVQEGKNVAASEEIARVESRLTRLRRNSHEFADLIADDERELTKLRGDGGRSVSWPELVESLTAQQELRAFAGEIWRSRMLGGTEMADDPARLAEMFLFRELFRRPRVQNNPETMGLLRLAFPRLEERAAQMAVPRPLAESGVDNAGWTGLALAAIDFVFRNYLAVDLPGWMVPLISPRFGTLNGVMAAGTRPEERTKNDKVWPGPNPGPRPTRLHEMIYVLIDGSPDNTMDADRAGEVLAELWSLLTTTATAVDVGKGVWRLDFSRAAVVRLDRGFVCPVTRRPFGYAVAGRSPYDMSRAMQDVAFPRFPFANRGGIAASRRAELAGWIERDPLVAELRRNGLWSDLHDRIAVYPPFLRAQEHSAQIERAVLQTYEREFKDGRINLLNCSTTMEMGVDIPQVGLIVNANVPPSVANYRQRVGRAGRRGEPWAFGITFCRDLPLDQAAFEDPLAFLAKPIAAPKVMLDSPALVARHVNAALLAFWIGERGGLDVRSSVGSFFGAGESLDQESTNGADVDRFIDDLRGPWGSDDARESMVTPLVAGTVLEGRALPILAAEAAERLEWIVGRWRVEHRQLLDRQDAADDTDIREAFKLRAQRLRGEFLLSELARRGFTPAYGFPTDIVSFDHLSGRRHRSEQSEIAFGERRGGASRSLDIAIREYAPGVEVIVDGLVHLSEGIRPAWGADADASRLEDFQELWHCTACEAFGLASLAPATCPQCMTPLTASRKVLRPVGFLGRRQPHTGYESLAHLPFEQPRLSAAGATWIAMADPTAGRYRADPEGQVIVTASGPHSGGFAVCLECGRAEAMGLGVGATVAPMPEPIRRHKPLARSKGSVLTRDGFCPGGYTKPQRVQRHVHLVHAARTDVFELQLSRAATRPAALAVAAGLREALAERLGLEAREIGPAVGQSQGALGERRISAFLHDRAAGGAGLCSRLMEQEMLAAVLRRSREVLDCRQSCDHGCPSCILRPDLNLRDIRIDRAGGLALVEAMLAQLELPTYLRLFGSETRLLGRTARDWIEDAARSGRLSGLQLYLHGPAQFWDLDAWPVAASLRRLAAAGVKVRIILSTEALTGSGIDMSVRLALHRLAANAELAHADQMPQAGDLPVIAHVKGAFGVQAIAPAALAEAVPGAVWGQGAEQPLVIGPIGGFGAATVLTPMRLLGMGTGNARLIWIGNRLDGALTGFGKRFWNLLAREAPLEVEVMQTIGVARLLYTDRYLLTPLHLTLLAEICGKAPGSIGAEIVVQSAKADRLNADGWAVFHVFPDDDAREDVLSSLLSNTSADLKRRKDELPHHRAIQADLRDGRRLSILIDQGMGAWRADGAPRHDFRRSAAIQARSLRTSAIQVVAERQSACPISISID